jgi:quinol monooxygenase YgiN
MVVLAVTWMAKTGQEAEVAGVLSKLTEESRKEPGCVTYQVHRHKTEPRRFFIYEQYKLLLRLTADRHIFFSTQKRTFQRSPIAWKVICTSRWDEIGY